MKKLNTVSGETDSSIEAVSNLLAAGVPENRLQEMCIRDSFYANNPFYKKKA